MERWGGGAGGGCGAAAMAAPVRDYSTANHSTTANFEYDDNEWDIGNKPFVLIRTDVENF